MPYFVASGHSNPATGAPRLATGLTEPGFKSYYPDFPRVDWLGVFATIAFEGTNTLTADFIERNNLKYTGIVAADFPGDRLIKNIIKLNRKSGIFNNAAYTIALIADTNKVIDINNEATRNDATVYNYGNSVNQKFRFVFDYAKAAWQIKSMIDENLVLAWNDYAGSNNVFITPNQHKLEHYWDIYEVSSGVYTIENHKNNGNKVLHIENDSFHNLTNAAVGPVSDERAQFVLY